MPKKPIDLSRPYTTRDGREVFASRMPENPFGASRGSPFTGYVRGVSRRLFWEDDGRCAVLLDRNFDLINTPETREVDVMVEFALGNPVAVQIEEGDDGRKCGWHFSSTDYKTGQKFHGKVTLTEAPE